MTYYGEEVETPPDARRPTKSSIVPLILLGGLIGAAIWAILARLRFRSEEPPIRVKRGTTTFELLSTSIIWEPVGGSRRKWRLSDGEKHSDDYTADVVTKGGTSSHRGGLLRFYMNEHTFVMLQSEGRRTMLTSPQYDLRLSSDRRTLTHPLDIDRIQIDSKVPYFAKDAELQEVLVRDTR